MSMKILDVFNVIKKQEVLTKETQNDIIKVIQEMVKDKVSNPVDAYALLDFCEEIMKQTKETIKQDAIAYIEETTDFEGYGVKLVISKKTNYNYEQDDKWKELNSHADVMNNRIKLREKQLENIVNNQIVNSEKTCIGVVTEKVITPKYK